LLPRKWAPDHSAARSAGKLGTADPSKSLILRPEQSGRRFATEGGHIMSATIRGAEPHGPKIPLMQPALDVAMQKHVTGYQYWFHRQLDFRTLVKP
jgi:hypothetical protein